MTKTKEKRKRKPRILPPGYKWIQAVPVPSDVHRSFGTRCAREGLDKLQVLKILIEMYSQGNFTAIDEVARKRAAGGL